MAEASILLRPALTLTVTQEMNSGDDVSWTGSVVCQGRGATKTGFALRSEAYAWACEQVAQFELQAPAT